ncbi:hypothetical protein Tco_0853298 [Tanacetum coccineum]
MEYLNFNSQERERVASVETNARQCKGKLHGLMIRKYFIAYTKTDVPLDTGLVVTKSNETESERHVSSSKFGKDTHAEDADINFVNDKQPMSEVQLTAEHNILANEQQSYTHTVY